MNFQCSLHKYEEKETSRPNSVIIHVDRRTLSKVHKLLSSNLHSSGNDSSSGQFPGVVLIFACLWMANICSILAHYEAVSFGLWMCSLSEVGYFLVASRLNTRRKRKFYHEWLIQLRNDVARWVWRHASFSVSRPLVAVLLSWRGRFYWKRQVCGTSKREREKD